jgi:hypothetical protein
VNSRVHILVCTQITLPGNTSSDASDVETYHEEAERQDHTSCARITMRQLANTHLAHNTIDRLRSTCGADGHPAGKEVHRLREHLDRFRDADRIKMRMQQASDDCRDMQKCGATHTLAARKQMHGVDVSGERRHAS